MSDAVTTDQETLHNVLKMLNYLFEKLSAGDEILQKKCLTPDGRADLCEQFNISTTDKHGPGYAMVHYADIPTESPLVPWILHTFETAMGGEHTPFKGITPKTGPGELLYTKLWFILHTLLTDPDARKKFLEADPAVRMSILSGENLEESYDARTALSEYSQDARNQPLGVSMKTIENTLYNQKQFVC